MNGAGKKIRAVAVLLTLISLLVGFFQIRESHGPKSVLVTYPQSFESSCNHGRAKLYDECGSQVKLFGQALRTANEQEKTLLVSYGAEWCIWCHVFDECLTGSHTVMNYRYANPGETIYTDVTRYERSQTDPSKNAERLRFFSKENFVLVLIGELSAQSRRCKIV